MSITSAIAAGLIIAFALTGIVVCLSFPYARLVIMRMSPVTKRNIALLFLFSFTIMALMYYVDRSPLWLWFILLALVHALIRWRRTSHH